MLRIGYGFTLLELLVAMAIFSLVSAMAYGGLQAILKADHHTRQRTAMLAELQVTLALLERDLRQVVAVGYRDAFGDVQPPLRYSPLATEPELMLLRAGSGEEQRLRRVSWRGTEAGLERRLWEAVDAGDAHSPLQRVFLADSMRIQGLERPLGFELRFLVPGTSEVERLDAWPPLRGNTEPRLLPALIEIRLEVPGLGWVERHVALLGDV